MSMTNNNNKITATIIKIPFYPRIQLQEAVEEPIITESYT